MARINIDDSFFNDPRIKLLEQLIKGEINAGSWVDPEALAYGIALKGFRFAQWYWLKNEQLIPAIVFESLGLSILVEAGLAEHREGGFYVKGTREFSQWLQQKKDAGKASGLARNKGTTVERTLNENERPLNENERNRTLVERSANGNEPLYSLLSSLTQRDIKNISTSKPEGQPEAGLVPAGTECSPFDLEIAKQWADHAKSVSKTVRPKIPLWAKTVHDLRILDGWSEKNIRSILEQVKTDSFWQKNGASLPNIRKRSENGLTKAENIFSSFEKRKMDKQTHSVSKSNIYQREKLEYVPAIRDTPRQVVSNKPEFVPAIRDKPNEN